MQMEYSKAQRQRAVVEIVRSHNVSSQEEIVEQLAKRGFSVTQATVSRDLQQIGALKIRRFGRIHYSLPDQAVSAAPQKMESVLRQWVSAIDLALNIIVMRTPPGSAHIVGVTLDSQKLPGVVGTICGDDTIFIACRSAEEANHLRQRLLSKIEP